MPHEPANLQLFPIGFFRCAEQYSYDVARQGTLTPEKTGLIELREDQNLCLALTELAGFSHLWVIFWFHQNKTWRPLVRPPRHRRQKVGVFASRSPYRPNPLGLTCVRLLSVNGHQLLVAGHDLLDGTPILDIKPYLPFADAHPEATAGWTAKEQEILYEVNFSKQAETRLQWLESQGLACLRDFVQARLEAEPLNPKRHRLEKRSGDGAMLAYRTWRVDFVCQHDNKLVMVTNIDTGYTEKELEQEEDQYADKEIHRQFKKMTGEE